MSLEYAQFSSGEDERGVKRAADVRLMRFTPQDKPHYHVRLFEGGREIQKAAFEQAQEGIAVSLASDWVKDWPRIEH